MKRIHVFMIIMLSMALFSCNNNEDIKPVSEKINGPLGEFFQVVPDNSMNKDDQMVIGIQRVKEGWPVPMKTDAVLGICAECYEPSLMAEFIDKDGNVVAKSLTDCRSSFAQMETLMSLGLNESGTVSFAMAPKGANRVRLLSDFVYHGKATSNMGGTINETMDILMSLEFSPEHEALGGYYHEKFGPNAILGLMGELNGEVLTLDEYSFDGKRLGKFDGIFKDGAYEGSYASIDGKTYNFSLKEDALLPSVDYAVIDFGSFSEDPAFEVNNQEDYEQFYQEMFESQGILLSAKDTMHLVLNKEQLELAVGDCDTLVLTSYHVAMPVTWSSSNETVAMVGSSGVVRAIKEGETYIMASVQPNKRDTVTTSVLVKVKPAKKKTPSSPKKSTSLNLGYATYEPLPQSGMSGVKDGKPHGNGIMRFKQSHVIPGTQDCKAEPGEWVNGMWRDGKINAGTWYRNDGNQVIVKLGQRYNK